jgi:hypothetical protein
MRRQPERLDSPSMTSDDGDTSRLRTGRWLPNHAVHPPRGSTSGTSGPRPLVGEVAPIAAEPPIEPPTAPMDPLDAIRAADTDDGHGRGGTEGGMDGVTKPPGYLGHRREKLPAGRRWLWVGTAVVALCMVIAASLAMCSSPPGDHGDDGERDVRGGGQAVTGAADEPSSSDEASPRQSPAPSPSRSSVRPPFQPIGLEAEAGAAELGGAAEIITYAGASGGKIVQNLGRLGPGPKKSGNLTFPNVTVPADGAYTLTLYLVNNGSDASQTAVVTVAGGGSVTVTVAGGATCCVRKVVTINLKKGRNSVTFGNPDGRAPSVDRIVISAL